MRSSMDHPETMREMKWLLGGARRRVHRFALFNRIRAMLDPALYITVCAAGLYFLSTLAFQAAGRPFPIGWLAGSIVLASTLVLPLVMAAGLGILHRPSFRETAERLDLGTGRHNRIGIALALVGENRSTPFARAAVLDGIRHLERLKDGAPFGETRNHGRLRSLIMLVLAAGLTMASGWMGGTSLAVDETEAPFLATNGDGAGFEPFSVEASVPESRPRPDAGPIAESGNQGGDLERETSGLNESGAARGRPLNATPPARAGAKGAKAREQGASISGSGESMNPSSPPERTRKEEKENPPSGKTGKIRPALPGKKGLQDEGTIRSPGAAGGRVHSAVSNAWSQEIQTRTHEDGDEEPDEETGEEEEKMNTQRGGVQPLLKDRKEAPSRELGISGDQGPPGSGRGGPTPPKKSRGTASLVLGVPVPDFVRGRPGPGLTKVTHESGDPTSRPGTPALPAAAGARTLPEGPCPRFHPPPGFRNLVRDYLITLHSKKTKPPSGDKPPPEENRNKD